MTYSIDQASDLLDPAFYAGDASDGTGTWGRMAFFPRASNDGTTVAFWGVNTELWRAAIFLVDIGNPSGWRRLTDYLPSFSVVPIYWTPDNRFLITANGPSRSFRVPIAEGIQSFADYGAMLGTYLEDVSISRMSTANWVLTRDASSGTGIAAVPVLPNGSLDTTRGRTIVADLPGLRASWQAISPDGTRATFVDWHPGQPEGAADLGDVYVLNNLDAILAAPKQEGTDYSTLAATAWDDPNIITIENGPLPAYTPQFFENTSLLLFCEDFNNIYRSDNFFLSVLAGDWDVVVRNSDGAGSNVRIDAPEQQAAAVPTPGGTRLVFNRLFEDAAAFFGSVEHAMIGRFTVSTDVADAVTVIDEAENIVETTEAVQASDSSETVVDIPPETTIDFPNDAPQQIQISTPTDPATQPQLPFGVEGIPVIREFGPAGTTFDKPITITITYTDAEIDGFDEAALRVFLYDPDTQKYTREVTTITDRDLANNSISFTVDHFSRFGLGSTSNDMPLRVALATTLALAIAAILCLTRHSRMTDPAADAMACAFQPRWPRRP